MDELQGLVDRITYRDEESLYTVAQLSVTGERDRVTVVGTFPAIFVGEQVELSGEWSVHPKHGKQFKAETVKTLRPATLEGIEKYLASSLIKGIGPVTAKQMVKAFGKDTLRIIEEEPERLTEVSGIGEVKARTIAEAFREQRGIQGVMLFLASHNVSPAYSTRIFQVYGDETVAVLQDNPYRLAEDVHGIGFRIADKIARDMGVDLESPARGSAAIRFALEEAGGQGHVYLPEDLLLQRASEVLSGDGQWLREGLRRLVAAEEVILEEEKADSGGEAAGGDDAGDADDGDDRAAAQRAAYFAPYFHAERGVAKELRRLQRGFSAPKPVKEEDLRALLSGGSARPGPGPRGDAVELAKGQLQAVLTAWQKGVLVVTGGPGTGKTTTINSMISLFEARGAKVLLTAPTGRAAKRMTETSGRDAKTIHRLLEYGYVPGEGMAFKRNRDNPLRGDVLVVDEVSMVDLLLMYNLLKALPDGMRVVFVGDADQLPSVGAGNVLKDLIAANTVPVVRLREVFRQAAESMIVVNAHRINKGEFPALNKQEKDFFFIAEEDPERIRRILIGLCAERLPRFGQWDPVDDIQVLTPMRRTVIGVEALNDEMQQHLNPGAPGKPELTFGSRLFRLGDKVMQVVNNYDKDVFNGDTGRVVRIDLEEGEIAVEFPATEASKRVIYDRPQLDELVLAYAVSVHKSQGSEYPVVVMPVSTQHYMLLQRNLLYTAITRAKDLVVLVGTKKALWIAINNNKVQDRYTKLAQRLQAGW